MILARSQEAPSHVNFHFVLLGPQRNSGVGLESCLLHKALQHWDRWLPCAVDGEEDVLASCVVAAAHSIAGTIAAHVSMSTL